MCVQSNIEQIPSNKRVVGWQKNRSDLADRRTSSMDKGSEKKNIGKFFLSHFILKIIGGQFDQSADERKRFLFRCTLELILILIKVK